MEIDFFFFYLHGNVELFIMSVQCAGPSVVQLDHITLRQCQRMMVNDVKHDSDTQRFLAISRICVMT